MQFQDEREFGQLLGKVLSPSRPLQSAKFLRGREEQLEGIKRALYQPGRHVFIHGLRGVGKSSLAQTAAYSLSEGGDPILLSCDNRSTFRSIVKQMCLESIGARNPTLEKKTTEVSGGITFFGTGISGKIVKSEVGLIEEPESVNDAVRLLKHMSSQRGPMPIFVIDEFDQVKSAQEQKDFTNFVKQVSDNHLAVRFIFCGIGESVEAMLAAHGSADRYFHTVSLGQLGWDARCEIVEGAAKALELEIDNDTILRIARISDGFPHYVHFLSEKLFWQMFGARGEKKRAADLFALAVSDAAASMDMKLRGPYEIATQKYHNDSEDILWAAADGHELKRRSSDIWASYQRIMEAQNKTPVPRVTFNERINRLKRTSHACILTGSRQGWYEFTEKMLRGYVRLRAEQANVVLEADHPVLPRKFGVFGGHT